MVLSEDYPWSYFGGRDVGSSSVDVSEYLAIAGIVIAIIVVSVVIIVVPVVVIRRKKRKLGGRDCCSDA